MNDTDMELNDWITAVNDAVWGYVLVAALVGCGLWFTWRTGFVQFRMVGEMLRLLTSSAVDTVESQVKQKKAAGRRRHISSFQAFAVSVATRVGTGNLAGVATAIAVGGPGAVFWMWMIALLGAATAFVESTLAQLFKQRHRDSFIGGPAYYIQRGLHQRWMAVLFAVLITCQFGLSNNSIQANTICGAMQEASRVVAAMGGGGAGCHRLVHRLWRHSSHQLMSVRCWCPRWLSATWCWLWWLSG